MVFRSSPWFCHIHGTCVFDISKFKWISNTCIISNIHVLVNSFQGNSSINIDIWFFFFSWFVKFDLTGNDLMVQMTAFMSGAYLQLPTVVLNLGESASAGTGMMISTLLAVDLLLNWLLACQTRNTQV